MTFIGEIKLTIKELVENTIKIKRNPKINKIIDSKNVLIHRDKALNFRIIDMFLKLELQNFTRA